MKIILASRIMADPLFNGLSKLSGVEILREPDIAAATGRLSEAPVLIIADPTGAEGPALAKALGDQSSRVRWVQIVSVGTDGLMRQKLPDDLTVTYQGGIVAPIVAEHAMALLLSYGRLVPDIVRAQDTKTWRNDLSHKVSSVTGKTILIVGYGNIGRELAQRAAAFGMRVISASRSRKDTPLVQEWFDMDHLPEASGKADVIAVTVAYSPETEFLVGAKALSAAKKGALLLNVSRGRTVDTAALVEALQNGSLGGAILDVTDPEPLPSDHVLWGLPGVLISPHIGGGGGSDTRAKVIAMIAENIRRFGAGEQLVNVVKQGTRSGVETSA